MIKNLTNIQANIREAKLVEIKIDEAVAVEREACAKIAETLFPHNGNPLSVGQDIALQIRDR